MKFYNKFLKELFLIIQSIKENKWELAAKRESTIMPLSVRFRGEDLEPWELRMCK